MRPLCRIFAPALELTMIKMRHCLALVAVVAATLSCGAQAADESCRVRLSIQLTPDAAKTDNPGFLNSLVADPQYTLRWVKGDDTAAVVDLSGPASDSQCQQGIDLLSRSAHVVDIKVIDSSATDT
jgi:hypothetical protein